MSHPPVHTPAFLQGVTAGQLMAWSIGLAVAVALLALAVSNGRMAKAARAAAAAASTPAKTSSGGGRKLLLAAAAIGGGAWFYETHLKTAAAPAKAAPAPHPHPTPQPTVTRTVSPHAVTHITMPHLSGGVVVAIFVIAAVVAIVLLGPVLRRSS